MKFPNNRVWHFLKYGQWPRPLRLTDLLVIKTAVDAGIIKSIR